MNHGHQEKLYGGAFQLNKLSPCLGQITWSVSSSGFEQDQSQQPLEFKTGQVI